MKKIIEISNVEKIYSENEVAVHALRGVSLDIEEKDFLVLSGASGSGKTTLLNVIGTLDAATSGDVKIEGEDISNLSEKALSKLRLNNIGFVFQAYNLIPVLTAIENVEFAMVLQKVPEKIRREKSMNVLEELGIGELANKRPNQMSGGQQQRVAVARAIVTDPLLVLADEPTANLDSEASEVLLDIMKKMNEEKGITFVFASHDTQVMERAKRLITLKDGVIISEK
ncbi:MAG: macrolide ABC transporter ATP-binding protein [Bacteroidetes bacterium 4572_77]|nr:MAG: macrolide ABC transporter ATP-binding protein [Bacteroidetes bacterium 4572_77]